MTGCRARLATGLFTLYRRTLSPVLAASGLGHCRYLPTCSEYAMIAVVRHGWLRGSALALGRVARCHPWSRGGHDPVPGGMPAATAGEAAGGTATPHTAARRHHLP